MNKIFIILILFISLGCSDKKIAQPSINKNVTLLDIYRPNKLFNIKNLSNKMVLFFNFTDDCGVCYDQQLEIIKQIKNKSIIIITNIDNYKKAKLYFESHHIVNTVYIINNKEPFFNNNIETPIYIKTGLKNKIISYFQPDKEQPEQTKKYLINNIKL